MKNIKQHFPSLPSDQCQQLALYLDLMIKWNKIYNLTAIAAREQMITHHLLDSLAIAPYLKDDRFVDVGTGAGLPGIPLAITRPDKQFTLLDSNSKKTRFCQQAAAELSLNNVTVVHSRVENYQPAEKFDGVMSRAFASLNDMVKGCQHLIDPRGHYLAMKGQLSKAELSSLPKQYQVDIKLLHVPDLDAERCLVIISC